MCRMSLHEYNAVCFQSSPFGLPVFHKAPGLLGTLYKQIVTTLAPEKATNLMVYSDAHSMTGRIGIRSCKDT